MDIELSVIVPVHNEQDNVVPLLEEITASLAPLGRRFEVVFVDDCSSDETLHVLTEAQRRFAMLRVISHERNCGQSSAIRTGVKAARGRLIATLDGDGQNDPADIPRLWHRYLELEPAINLGMVGGCRRKRRDSFVKRAASRVGNTIRRWILQDEASDVGCGLKVFARETFLDLPYFDHMHRYMPALMQRQGRSVVFVDVNHRPRASGRSNYGVLDRLWVSLGDLIGVVWLRRRCRLPQAPREIPPPRASTAED